MPARRELGVCDFVQNLYKSLVTIGDVYRDFPPAGIASQPLSFNKAKRANR
jgi:hypothetical protein